MDESALNSLRHYCKSILFCTTFLYIPTMQKNSPLNRLPLLSKITDLMEHMDQAADFIQTTMDLLQKEGFTYSSVKLLHTISDQLKVAYSAGLNSSQTEAYTYRVGEGISGTVASSGQEITLFDTDKDPRFKDKMNLASGYGSYSFYCHPIRLNDTIIGVFSSLCPKGTRQQHEANSFFFQTLSPFIAQSLRITKKFDSVSKDFARENRRLQQELSGKKNIQNMIGKGSKMQAIFDQIENVAPTLASVLIQGANGTGKELIADALHYHSLRKEKPLIKINCAALPESLLESELFGHEKGAFTGAIHQKKGRFELAHGGTIFLDEIGEMPPLLQSKLLRVLQNLEFERVGGERTIQVDVRIIAATNKKLGKEVELGNFREDLYYRLNVFPVFVPSLVERKTDILLLAEHFLDKYAKQNIKDIKRISTPAIDLLMTYHWPGNVRELENCMERAVIVAQMDVIRAQDLPPSLQTSDIRSPHFDENWSLPQAVENLEREMIMEALKRNDGHQGKAARALDITERQMGYKIKKYHLLSTSAHDK